MRVVSLLPSATELLCAVGGEDLLVGRSHECDWPPSVADRPVLTGQRITPDGSSAEIDEQVRTLADGSATSLYTLDADRLRALKPDLVLTQDLCDVCSIDLETVRVVAAEMPEKPQVLSLNPMTLFEVFDDVLQVGTAIGRQAAAQRAMVDLRDRYWSAIDYVNPYVPGPEVLFLEWTDPPFVGGHWTPGLIEAAGGTHGLNPDGAKSRQVTPDEIVSAAPERVIICPCGFDLDRIDRELAALQATDWWRALPAVANGQPGHVVAVDGNAMFNRPGPRLVDAFQWLVAWLNERPALRPEGFPVRTIN
ncbi:MAG: cobalamin-binding protein [Phycisphaerales bacterium]|nr:cobalamin-binding protein [Phycisphaerales bacterium]